MAMVMIRQEIKWASSPNVLLELALIIDQLSILMLYLGS